MSIIFFYCTATNTHAVDSYRLQSRVIMFVMKQIKCVYLLIGIRKINNTNVFHCKIDFRISFLKPTPPASPHHIPLRSTMDSSPRGPTADEYANYPSKMSHIISFEKSTCIYHNVYYLYASPLKRIMHLTCPCTLGSPLVSSS